MAFITVAWMVKERLREVREQLDFARLCLGEPTRGRKHNQTGKRARPSKKGKRR